jgi:hypothetical protein
MKSIVFLSLLLLVPALVFAQSQKITLNFDEKSFQPGQIAELKGSVDPSLAGKPVAVEVKDGKGQIIIVRTVQPDASGNFVLKFKVPANANSGFEVASSVESQGESISESKKIDESIVSKPISEKSSPVCGKGTVLENGMCVPEKKPQTNAKSANGCLIATATYGTELAPQVQLLREIRDNTLFGTGVGTSFMAGFNEFYYTFSPTIADWERENPVFREFVKIAITPMMSTLTILNYVELGSEGKVVAYGIGIILLNVGLYVGVPLLVTKYSNKLIKAVFHTPLIKLGASKKHAN